MDSALATLDLNATCFVDSCPADDFEVRKRNQGLKKVIIGYHIGYLDFTICHNMSQHFTTISMASTIFNGLLADAWSTPGRKLMLAGTEDERNHAKALGFGVRNVENVLFSWQFLWQMITTHKKSI